MKILYGVQGTGNGHMSRSREVITDLKAMGHDIHVVFSGRDPSDRWDLQPFAPYTIYRGLTFCSFKGKLQFFKTARQLNLYRFYRDIAAFNASGFDLVITDYEPITARVAQRNDIFSIGLGHQYAFFHQIPVAGSNFFTMWLLKQFAPVDCPIGLHWSHFNQPILPPIVPHFTTDNNQVVADKILVYLPFEEKADILSLLQPHSSHRFFIYGVSDIADQDANRFLRPFSRSDFLADLQDCNGVITNAGFELTSEALQLGKKILVKPLAGQMEQLSNALAVSQLGLGMVMQSLDSEAVGRWLNTAPSAPMGYPDVAQSVADWISKGRWSTVNDLTQSLWAQTQMSQS